MEANKIHTFQSISDNVGQFNLRKKTFLIPEMSRIGCHLLAGSFRSFGINAIVLETYKGLDLGKEFTSGKECFPCQVTTGDILFFLNREKERLGDDFNPLNYIYFMPEATGPCRFGMYNKYQRIVLDSFPELRKLKIGSLTTGNSYSLEGMLNEDSAKQLRKVAYFGVIIGDALDRLLWRIRPYEKEPGMADNFIERAMNHMSDTFETYGSESDFEKILDELEKIIIEGKAIIDPGIARKPLIGIVGEIYLRTHTYSNQDLVCTLEKFGAEVVVSSLTEWMDFTAYENSRLAKIELRRHLKHFRVNRLRSLLKDILNYDITLCYQQKKQKDVYKLLNSHIDLPEAHRVADLEKIVKEYDLFSFDIGTEAGLSIAGLVEYAKEAYNGVVNVYPFTCMPGTITSAVIKPIMNQYELPYLDAPYDDTYQPGREATIRTFMYQAQQHYKRNGRQSH
jgi:predicted nucleotide-binding protein (sugar kinase/HSP70/actin superfamily)